MNLDTLLNDKSFLIRLINGPCKPVKQATEASPIRADWIDESASDMVTDAFHRLLPDGIPYLTRVLVEKNPDTILGGTGVDDNEKRQRYVVLTVLPDTEKPYNYSFPLIHQMWTVSLYCWEIIRAAVAAANHDVEVRIVEQPKPPILNNAKCEWVNIYLGRKPYEGYTLFSQMWDFPKDLDDLDADMHVYMARDMASDELLADLVQAYDTDYPLT